VAIESPLPSPLHRKRYDTLFPTLLSSTYPLTSLFDLTIAFQLGNDLPSPSTVFDRADELLNPSRKTSPPDEWKHWVCELCKRDNEGDFILVGGEAEWNAHQQTRLHRNRVRRLKEREAWEEWKNKQAEKAKRDLQEANVIPGAVEIQDI
jgi:hypothetical protein